MCVCIYLKSKIKTFRLCQECCNFNLWRKKWKRKWKNHNKPNRNLFTVKMHLLERVVCNLCILFMYAPFLTTKTIYMKKKMLRVLTEVDAAIFCCRNFFSVPDDEFILWEGYYVEHVALNKQHSKRNCIIAATLMCFFNVCEWWFWILENLNCWNKYFHENIHRVIFKLWDP